MDYIIDIAYNNVPEYKKMIDEVPMNNPNIHTIEEMLNDSYTSFYDDTWLYKLTYKKAFLSEIDGCSTFYKVICETRISDNEE